MTTFISVTLNGWKHLKLPNKKTMSRHFAEITKEEFLKKIEDVSFQEDETILKDLDKVHFDFENYTTKEDEPFCDYPAGYRELTNGIHAYFVNAGGDWECPICFVIYWDGKKLRGYIPKNGNLWNRLTHTAFGSEGDYKNFSKDFPDLDTEEVMEKGTIHLANEAIKNWLPKNVAEDLKEAMKNEEKMYILESGNICDVLCNENEIIADVMARIVKKGV